MKKLLTLFMFSSLFIHNHCMDDGANKIFSSCSVLEKMIIALQ
jgi:hypothetical protein